ncbi:MAG: hypothetical protein ACLFR0_07235, partial [Alphaproteobacteria bacterium]
LIPENPRDARNRRITLILLREELTDPEAYKAYLTDDDFNTEEDGTLYEIEEAPQVPIGTFRKTPGKIEFP